MLEKMISAKAFEILDCVISARKKKAFSVIKRGRVKSNLIYLTNIYHIPLIFHIFY